MGQKTVDGVTGVGVSGGGSIVDAEMDHNEAISFTSPTAQTLTGFTLAFLYSNGFMGDTVFEAALLDATGVALIFHLAANHRRDIGFVDGCGRHRD